MINFNRYLELKPLALELLYSFENKKLPYYEEINKQTEIIKILHNNLK
jgi:hypothetical protein